LEEGMTVVVVVTVKVKGNGVEGWVGGTVGIMVGV
jgi:hypothetical protein